MKIDRVTPLVGVIILVAVIAWNTVRSRSSEPQYSPALPVITSEVQPMTVDGLHARFRRTLEASMSGHYSLSVDKDAHTITCDTWVDGFDAFAVNTALRSRDYLRRWNENTAELCSMCAEMQTQVDNHGHDEYVVAVRFVNCEDLGQVFAVAERGDLVYDVVEDTPPGGSVPDPTKRVQPVDTENVYGSFVLNIYSKVFHTESCSYAPQLAAVYRSEFTGNRDELIDRGFYPCVQCMP